MSLSVISEILGLSLTHWLQMTTILFIKVEIYHNQFKCNYVRKKKFSPHFLIQFWNLNQILNILKKKDDTQSLCIPEMWLDKSLKTSVSDHRFTINMVKGTKECRNLYWGTFIQISHYYESNRAGKCLFYWYLKFYDRLLIDSLLMTRILFTIGKIYKNQLKYNYLIKKKLFFQFFAWFLKSTSNYEHFDKKRLLSWLMCFGNYRLQNTWLKKCLKSPVSEYCSTDNMPKGPKQCWNLHDGTFLMLLSSWRKWTLKISLLVMYEILRLFFNTMTGDGKYFLRNSKNLSQPGQM